MSRSVTNVRSTLKKWGIDVIDPINPKATNGHRFILEAIDYLTKRVEAISFASIIQKVFVKFLKTNIICRYGIPQEIIMDNATNLNGAVVTGFNKLFKIKHHNSTPYRPQMNGVIEVDNKNVKKIISKMIVTYQDWHEMLPYVLHGYCTTMCTSTRATPYSLVYEIEAVTPNKVEISSLSVFVEANLEECEWIKARFEQLNVIEGKRLDAMCCGKLYQSRMARAFNRKFHPREFQVDDLVLHKTFPNLEDARGK